MTTPGRNASLALPRAERARIENGRLRVLVVHNRYRSNSPSGENDVVDAEISALRELGHDVVSYQRSSDEIDTLPLGQRAGLPIRAIHSRRDVAAVLNLVTSHQPDVIHVHNLNPLISPAVIPAVRSTGTPVVMTVHNYRLVCADGTFFRDDMQCRDCVGRRVATPAIRHGCYRGSRAQSAPLVAAIAVHRDSYLSVERFIAPSPCIADFIQDLGVPAERVTLKPHTAPDPGQPTVAAGDGFVFVGRLVPSKGATMLVSAWLRQPEGRLGRLTIVGDGPDRSRIEQMVGQRRDVALLGHVPAATVAEQIRRHAVVVVPSRWPEPFGRVVIESMAHGRAVVTTRIGSLPEIVGDGGWVADPSTDDLERALITVAATDTAAVGRRARARYELVYSPDVVNAALVATYREVADMCRRVPRNSGM